jgi:hypothetical protein
LDDAVLVETLALAEALAVDDLAPFVLRFQVEEIQSAL